MAKKQMTEAQFEAKLEELRSEHAPRRQAPGLGTKPMRDKKKEASRRACRVKIVD